MSDGETESTASVVDGGLPSRGPLVFISHDSRDADLAEALSKLLSSVSAGMLKTFRSSDKKGSQGFEYGVEWYPELMKTLESACDVVCLLTDRGLGRPWMLYEAGVAKGKLDVPVHGLALGVPLSRASIGPFAQFQNCGDDVESITKLAVQLVQRLPHADPDVDTVRAQVQAFKDRVDEVLSEQPADDDDADVIHGEASTAKLFEEIKVMFQDLPPRLERAVLDDSRGSRSRLRRWHPGMVEEMIMMSTRGEPRPGFAILMVASFFKDEIPWLYEMASEAYRQSLLGNVDAERRAVGDFVQAWEMVERGPFSRELRMTKDMHMMFRDLPMMLERFTEMRGGLQQSDE